MMFSFIEASLYTFRQEIIVERQRGDFFIHLQQRILLRCCCDNFLTKCVQWNSGVSGILLIGVQLFCEMG